MDTTFATPDRNELFALLCQVENLQHQRIYYFLVAESIFYLAAATALKEVDIVMALAVAGIVTAMLFTFTNYKLYLRILFLSAHMKLVDPFYKDYIGLKNFEKIVPSGKGMNAALALHIASESQSKPSLLHSGWLFSFGLGFLISATWSAFIYYALNHAC